MKVGKVSSAVGTAMGTARLGTLGLVMMAVSCVAAAAGGEGAFVSSASAAAEPTAASSSSDGAGAIQLQEVTVTATRRRERLENVPMALSVVSQDQIAQRGLNSILDLTRTVPGLQYSEVGGGQRNGDNIIIRGISNTRYYDTGGTAALTTGFYVNDVAMQPVDPNLFDASRVEVLKGPQGTYFGQASMGGTVRVILNDPDVNEMRGTVAGSYAETKGGDPVSSVDGMLNIPIIAGTLAARIVASKNDNGGYIDWYPASLNPNIPRGTASPDPVVKNANNVDENAARVELLWTPGDRLSVEPMIFYQSLKAAEDDAYDRNLNEGLVQSRYVPETRGVTFSVGSLTARYKFDHAELTSVTAFSDRKYTAQQDLTWNTAETYGFNTDGSIPAAMPYLFNYDTKTLSHEDRLAGNMKLSERSNVDWLIGFEYLREFQNDLGDWSNAQWNANADNGNMIPNGTATVVGFVSNPLYSDKAEFGDLTWNLGRLSLSGGFRHYFESNHSVGYDYGDAVGNVKVSSNNLHKESGTVPRASISYKLTPNVSTYFLYSQGFRIGGTGGAAALYDTPVCQDALDKAGLGGYNGNYNSDSVSNYEFGLKGLFNDAHTRINVDIYREDWSNLQQGVDLTDYNSGCTNILTANIGSARTQGFELEINQVLMNWLEIGGTADLTDAKIVSAPPGTSVYVGEPLGGVPKWTGSVHLRADQPLPNDLNGFAAVYWSYRASMIGPVFSTATDPFVYDHAYADLDLQVGVERDKWTAILFVDNALNKIGEIGAGALAGEPFTDSVQITRPRTTGFRASYRW